MAHSPEEIQAEIQAITDAPGGGRYSQDFILQAFILSALRDITFEIHVGHHLGVGQGHPDVDDHPGHDLDV